jgi:hypothetical protein
VSIAITAVAPAALADHGRGVAGPQIAVGDRVIAGSHHVSGEQGVLVAHARGHTPQNQIGVRDQRLLGLGAL